MKKMTGDSKTASPYAAAPLFDPSTAVVTDPASIPPVIRGNISSEAAFGPSGSVSPSPASSSSYTPVPVGPLSQTPAFGEFNVSGAERTAVLAARVTELESQIAKRDAVLASREEEIATLHRARPVTPSELPTVQTVAKVVAESTAKPLILPVIAAPDVKVAQHGSTIRVTIPDGNLFQSGSYELSPMGEETLRQVVSEVNTMYPNAAIEIEGHSDNVVTNPQNPTQLQEVTCYKANIVMRYLVSSLGVSAAKIHPSGFGATCPVAENTTDEGRKTNRRFVLVVRPFAGE